MNTTTATRTNRYAATCYKCGRNVAAGTGILTNGGGKWITEHTDCGTATVAPATLQPGWSNASRARRGYTATARCNYCGGTVRGGGCTDCGEGHEDY